MNQSNDDIHESSLQQENTSLRRTVLELSILNEIAAAISSAQSVAEIERLIIKKCIKHLMVEEGIIMLLEETDEPGAFATMMRTRNSVMDSFPNKLDDQLIGWMLKNKTALVINNLNEDKRFNTGDIPATRIRSVLCVPMFVKSRMIGVLTLFNKINASFSDDDKRLLSICASQSAQVIENARLYEQESVLEKLQKEMSLASQIQNNLLPRSLMKMNGVSIIGKTLPAKVVGGDFYDVVPLSDGSVAFWLGDVSGKGMPAALLMANIQGVLRSNTIMEKNIGDCLSKVNTSMCENSEADKFATICYARLNATTNHCSFISAGHNNLIHLRLDGEINYYRTNDIPVGIYPGYHFSEKTIEFSHGDTFVLYSDGIIEAENPEEEPFGEPRLVEILKTYKQLPPEQLLENIFSSVNRFTQQMPQSDDQTLLIVTLVDT